MDLRSQEVNCRQESSSLVVNFERQLEQIVRTKYVSQKESIQEEKSVCELLMERKKQNSVSMEEAINSYRSWDREEKKKREREVKELEQEKAPWVSTSLDDEPSLGGMRNVYVEGKLLFNQLFPEITAEHVKFRLALGLQMTVEDFWLSVNGKPFVGLLGDYSDDIYLRVHVRGKGGMKSRREIMSEVAREMLDMMTENRQLSEDGRKWFTIAADPFHDNDVDSRGYPDISTARTNVQCVNFQTTVVSPTPDSTAPWDAHIFFNPCTPVWSQTTTSLETTTTKCAVDKKDEASHIILEKKRLRQQRRKDERVRKGMIGSRKVKVKNAMSDEDVSPEAYYRSTLDYDGTLVQTGGGLVLYSGWNGITVPVGDDWTTASSGTSTNEIGMPLEQTSGPWRLISTGCEVTNTTASLYKGGSVTVYRSPSTTASDSLMYPSTGAAVTKFGLLPPSNLPDATIYPDKKTWGAEDGVYMVATMNSDRNPFLQPIPRAAGLISPSDTSSILAGEGWLAYVPPIATWQDESPLPVNLTTSLTDVTPFDISGAIFSGLNQNTTLQVVVKYYFERAPTVAESDLLVLAQKPAPYDPVALELYSRSLNKIPVGVPVGENPLGEWFDDVLEGVAEWGPKIGNALGSIGVPFVQPIGAIVGSGASSLLQDRKKERQVVQPAKIPASMPSSQKPAGGLSKNARRNAARKAKLAELKSLQSPKS